jgi:chromosome partitioning protein
VQTILIANPKGGSGKTTLATNVAGWLAGKRQRVVLEDRDPQQSSTGWLARRPALFPPIAAANAQDVRKVAREVDAQWLVVDSAAGLHGEDLRAALKGADVMLVPVSASVYDMAASERFLAHLAQLKSIRDGGVAIGLVAMRVDARTISFAELEEFLARFDFPIVGRLRDAQVYVHCARDGATIFDLPRSRAEQDWEEWRSLARWIAKHAAVRTAR